MKPEVPIEVDSATGEWSVDGVPMILVPRHFFLNNHLAVESERAPGRREPVPLPRAARWAELVARELESFA